MFLDKKEEKLNKEYLSKGFIIHKIENLKPLNDIRDLIINLIIVFIIN